MHPGRAMVATPHVVSTDVVPPSYPPITPKPTHVDRASAPPAKDAWYEATTSMTAR